MPNKSLPLNEYNYSSLSTGWRPIGLNGAPLACCAACHGLDGTGAVTEGQAPNLAILDSAHIAARLREYASGARQSGIVAVVASSLSEPQIDALATYFADWPPILPISPTARRLHRPPSRGGAPDPG